MQPGPPGIFDRALLRQRRSRAARRFADHEFLARAAAQEMQERLEVLCPAPVERGAVLGAVHLPNAGRLMRTVIRADLAEGFAPVLADEETLPFAPQSLNLYASILTLHTVNDVPGALIQIRRALAPGGRFVAALFGPQTLKELRACLQEAELACEDGVSPRIHPFIDVRDAGALLQRAGFQEPVADTIESTAVYGEPLRLLRELQGMGETNILIERRKGPLRRATLAKALDLYRERHAVDGGVAATFELVFLSGKARP